MITFDNDIKIYQTLPGQGWRVLIEIVRAQADAQHEEHPVVAWVSFRDESDYRRPSRLAPIVNGPAGLYLHAGNAVVYLAPGEERTDAHDTELSRRILKYAGVK